jgi:hypothetical protein
MVGMGDTRDYTGSGLWRVIPYIWFELLMFLCLDVCSRGTNWSGEGFETQVPGVSDSCSLKAYMSVL